MKTITCCKDCKPPKRHREPRDCHMDCPEYLKEKAELDEDKQKYIEDRDSSAGVDAYYRKTRGIRKRKRKGR